MSLEFDPNSPGGLQLQRDILEELKKYLGADNTDEVLPQYCAVLLAHGHQEDIVRQDLEAFLGADSATFTAWLFEHYRAHKGTLEAGVAEPVRPASPEPSRREAPAAQPTSEIRKTQEERPAKRTRIEWRGDVLEPAREREYRSERRHRDVEQPREAERSRGRERDKERDHRGDEWRRRPVERDSGDRHRRDREREKGRRSGRDREREREEDIDWTLPRSFEDESPRKGSRHDRHREADTNGDRAEPEPKLRSAIRVVPPRAVPKRLLETAMRSAADDTTVRDARGGIASRLGSATVPDAGEARRSVFDRLQPIAARAQKPAPAKKPLGGQMRMDLEEAPAHMPSSPRPLEPMDEQPVPVPKSAPAPVARGETAEDIRRRLLAAQADVARLQLQQLAAAEAPIVTVTNVHAQANPHLLAAHFGRCGQIVRVDIEHDATAAPTGRARIRFTDAAAAKNALQLSGSSFLQRPIMVFSKPPPASLGAPGFAKPAFAPRPPVFVPRPPFQTFPGRGQGARGRGRAAPSRAPPLKNNKYIRPELLAGQKAEAPTMALAENGTAAV